MQFTSHPDHAPDPEPEVISPWPAAPVPGVEDWLPIPGTEGMVEFSVYLDGDTRPLGWVRSWYGPIAARVHAQLRREPLVISPTKNRFGYRTLGVWYGERRKLRFAHQLRLEIYAGPRSDGLVTRHLDGDKLNNHPGNLAWGTHKENEADRGRHNSRNAACGSRSGNAKLTESNIEPILRARIAGEPETSIARRYGCSRSLINLIASGTIWRHVTSVEPCASLLAQYRAQLAQRRSALCGPASLPAAQTAVRR